MTASITELQNKPWARSAAPRTIDFPIGMIGREERQLLYWLASKYYSGAGAIVDAGAYAGASAYCLAAGLTSSPHGGSLNARIDSYDLFHVDEAYIAEALSRSFGPNPIGTDFRDVFEYQVGGYLDRVTIHQGDFMQQKLPEADVEILFIDIAKTEALNSRVLNELFPKLIPGQSIVVQQDYAHAWHPYIHVSMHMLDRYFELVDPLVRDQSRVWRLKETIPTAVLAEAARKHSTEETIACLDQLIDREISEVRTMLRAIKLWAYLEAGWAHEAQAYSVTLPSTNPEEEWAAEKPIWRRQLAEMRRHMKARA